MTPTEHTKQPGVSQRLSIELQSQIEAPSGRTDRLALFLGLRGVCTALRWAVDEQTPVGITAVHTVMALRAELSRLISGRFTNKLPEPEAEDSPADLLALVEAMRAAVLAELNPQEIESLRELTEVNAYK